jgi:hypothetical protein
MAWDIGEKPGKGKYGCTTTNCDWRVVLDNDSDKLPPSRENRSNVMMHANKQQNNTRRRSGLVLALVGLLSVTGLVKGPTTLASAQAEARSWSYTGSLNVARAHHTATRLSDGKVLVVLGALAELYDPSTGTWSVTGNLNAGHSSFFTATHTATLLEDGKVLVAGGNTAEVYDPVTGLWSLTGNLNAFHLAHTATLLRDGKVLIAGGGNTLNYFATNAAEVYDPATRTWSLTGNLNEGRLEHTATLLENGEVLVAGGVPIFDEWPLNSAELYDPATKTWRFTGSLNAWRVDHAAVLLPNGDVLAAGGDYSLHSASEIYHVAEGTGSDIAGFSNRFYLTLTLLQNGKALATGGDTFGIGIAGDAHLYNAASGSWKQTAKLNEPRASHTATLLSDGKVLVVGGELSCCSGFLRSAELYDPEILDPAPKIISASVSGKKLFITGENFDDGAVILLNGEEQKTKQPTANPQTSLIGKKAGKKVKPGDRVQVRNPDGTLSEEFIFTGS